VGILLRRSEYVARLEGLSLCYEPTIDTAPGREVFVLSCLALFEYKSFTYIQYSLPCTKTGYRNNQVSNEINEETSHFSEVYMQKGESSSRKSSSRKSNVRRTKAAKYKNT
jgi:hypothetical protein